MDFGGQESFGEWLARVGLEDPNDCNSHDAATTTTKITPAQREELETLWYGAAEADTVGGCTC
jgi:hypothetical protein